LFAVLTVVVTELLRPATYTSEALLIIKPHRTWLLNPPAGKEGSEDNFIRNQMEILRSRRLLEPLGAIKQIAQTPELEYEKDIPAAIGGGLKIQQRNASEFYVVSFTSVSPKHAQAIVAEVVKAYLSYHLASEARHDNMLVEGLKKQGDARYREMSQLREQVKTKTILLTGKDPFRVDQDGSLDVSQELLRELQSELVRQQVELELLAADVATAEKSRVALPEATGDAVAEVDDSLDDVKQEYAATLARVKGLQERTSSLLASQKQSTGDTLDLEFLRSKLAAVTAVHDALHSRILALVVEQGAAHRVEVFSEATLPVQPDRRWWEVYR
jgi:uncharacterized protein involved in exopolysaccharide biosynthesis